MSDDERRDWLGMKAKLRNYLVEVDEQILTYPIRGSDEGHDFLIKKAISYRDSIVKINLLLID